MSVLIKCKQIVFSLFEIADLYFYYRPVADCFLTSEATVTHCGILAIFFQEFKKLQITKITQITYYRAKIQILKKTEKYEI